MNCQKGKKIYKYLRRLSHALAPLGFGAWHPHLSCRQYWFVKLLESGMCKSPVSSIINGDRENVSLMIINIFTKHVILWKFPLKILQNQSSWIIWQEWLKQYSTKLFQIISTWNYILYIWAIITLFQNYKIQPKATWQ